MKPTNEILCLAHRYLYYVLAAPVISDVEYDGLEHRALTLSGPDSPLRRPGSCRPYDYSPKVVKLAKRLLRTRSQEAA